MSKSIFYGYTFNECLMCNQIIPNPSKGLGVYCYACKQQKLKSWLIWTNFYILD